VRYRRLGDSELEVSEISLGSWLTYGDAVGRDQARACIDAAFECGINFIDTANVLAGGRAEECLGDILQSRPRDSYVLATKVYFEMPDGDRGLSRAQIHKQIDASLGRLRTDYVDLYMCHAFDRDVPLDETLGALTEVVRAGKVRHVGVSNWTGGQIRRGAAVTRKHGFARIASSQPEYSLLRRTAERGIIPASADNGISQIAWSPLAQGVLTGKYTPGAAFAPHTRAAARSDTFMARYLTRRVLTRVQRLGPIAEALGISTAQLSLAWVLHQPTVGSATVGATRPEQVLENAGASGIDLDESTLRAIEEAVRP
jgi:aryl-alcohol dehydrogenase-like predicted oxidoreductase